MVVVNVDWSFNMILPDKTQFQPFWFSFSRSEDSLYLQGGASLGKIFSRLEDSPSTRQSKTDSRIYLLMFVLARANLHIDEHEYLCVLLQQWTACLWRAVFLEEISSLLRSKRIYILRIKQCSQAALLTLEGSNVDIWEWTKSIGSKSS